MLHLSLSITTLLDEMSNAEDRACAALPDRLYLLGADGRILYWTEPRPGGLKHDKAAPWGPSTISWKRWEVPAGHAWIKVAPRELQVRF